MSHLIIEDVDPSQEAFLYLNLHEAEEINLVVRHHWAGFLGTFGLTFMMGLVPLLIVYVSYLVFSDNIDTYFPFIVIAVSGFYLFLLTFLFGSWIDYYYDIIFVTNERILNVNQKGLLSREISELSLHQVQNVTTQMDGFIQTFFNFGNLIIETAGEGTTDNQMKHGIQGYFSVAAIPDPNRIARIILELHRKNDEKDHV